jgi:hypothetical protein
MGRSRGFFNRGTHGLFQVGSNFGKHGSFKGKLQHGHAWMVQRKQCTKGSCLLPNEGGVMWLNQISHGCIRITKAKLKRGRRPAASRSTCRSLAVLSVGLSPEVHHRHLHIPTGCAYLTNFGVCSSTLADSTDSSAGASCEESVLASSPLS